MFLSSFLVFYFAPRTRGFSFNASQVSTQYVCRIASAFAELALAYYREEGKRIKSRVEKRSSNSLDLNVRYCFKVSFFITFAKSNHFVSKYLGKGRLIHPMTARSLYMQSFVEIGVKH